MEPFNIRIQQNDKDVTLTVLPEGNYFKLIYFGGIIGAIRESNGAWELLPEEEIEPGGLPFYDYKKGLIDQPELTLNLPKINQIAAEIENIIH
ncbi:hypothetical protein [Pedobacter insulae]|uniref:Uncharacterized protein n=1 Tax=Pedobacter insulae TaxID=414048 RepID=A0A1I2WLG6_9SPHI|nr:hypothetical protein [Pedobacter insulae]SFH02064.1 hypothetical protein SAMN04489864_104135 [Pedobacter insulae]